MTDKFVHPSVMERLVVGQRVRYVPARSCDYLPEGKDEYKFRSSKTRNDVPVELLLECPAVIDAESREEVAEYLEDFKSALGSTASGDFEEKPVIMDADGSFIEQEEED